MIFRFFNFDMSRGQGFHNNNNNNNGHFPEGGENQEIQQWRQSAPGQGVQETQTWMLWEKSIWVVLFCPPAYSASPAIGLHTHEWKNAKDF